MEAVQQEPEQRWQSVQDFAAALCAGSEPADGSVPREKVMPHPSARLAAPSTGAGSASIDSAVAELPFAITRYRKYNMWMYVLSLPSAPLDVRAMGYGIDNSYLPEILWQLLGITIAAGIMTILDRWIFRV